MPGLGVSSPAPACECGRWPPAGGGGSPGWDSATVSLLIGSLGGEPGGPCVGLGPNPEVGTVSVPLPPLPETLQDSLSEHCKARKSKKQADGSLGKADSGEIFLSELQTGHRPTDGPGVGG